MPMYRRQTHRCLCERDRAAVGNQAPVCLSMSPALIDLSGQLLPLALLWVSGICLFMAQTSQTSHHLNQDHLPVPGLESENRSSHYHLPVPHITSTRVICLSLALGVRTGHCHCDQCRMPIPALGHDCDQGHPAVPMDAESSSSIPLKASNQMLL